MAQNDDPVLYTAQCDNVSAALVDLALIPDDSDVAADTFGSAVGLTGHVRT